MEPGMTITGGIVALIINGVLLWIRELRKHRTWTKNGDALEEIKTQVECTDKKVGEIKVAIAEVQTEVKAQKESCVQTVNRFDEAMRDQGRELIKLAGERKR